MKCHIKMVSVDCPLDSLLRQAQVVSDICTVCLVIYLPVYCAEAGEQQDNGDACPGCRREGE
jgi:hypothetical protein